MKKLISILMVLAMVFSLVCSTAISAFAAEEEQETTVIGDLDGAPPAKPDSKPDSGEKQDPPEGEKQDPPEGEKQDPPEGEKQDPPEGEKQDPPEGEKQDPPEGEKQDPPEGEKQDPPEGEKQDPPEGEKQDPPEGEKQDPPPSSGSGDKVSVGVVSFDVADGALVLASVKDKDGNELALDPFTLTKNDDGTYKFEKTGNFTLRDASFALSDPAAGTLASKNAQGTVTLTFTPAGAEGGNESGDNTGNTGETGSETTDDSSWNMLRGPVENTLSDGMQIALELGGKTVKVDHGQITTEEAKIESEKMTIDSNWVYVEKVDGGYKLYVTGPGGDKDYVYVGDDGKLACAFMNPPANGVGVWVIAEDRGPATTTFTYKSGDDTWYLFVDDEGNITATKDSTKVGKGDMYSGTATETPGGPGGPGQSEPVDEDAPIVVKQMEAQHFLLKDELESFDSYTYTVSAKLPEGATATEITFTWKLGGSDLRTDTYKIAASEAPAGDQAPPDKPSKPPKSNITVETAEDGTVIYTCTLKLTKQMLEDAKALDVGVYALTCDVSCDKPAAEEEAPVEETAPAASEPADDAPKAVSSFTDGGTYVILVKIGDKDYAIDKTGKAVPYDGTPNPDITWNAKTGKGGGFFLVNDAGEYLTFSGTKGDGVSVATGTEQSSWQLSSAGLGYSSSGKVAEYIGGADGETLLFDKSTGAPISVLQTGGAAAADDGDDSGIHTVAAYTTNMIITNGVLDNSLITYSDVHQNWNSIGSAINDVIITHQGMIPALIISTGDYINGHGSVTEEQTADTLYRLALQMAGIDVVWTTGNHEVGTAANAASILADLGAAEDYDGAGIIYDYRHDSEKKDTSKNAQGLFVIGVNFDEQGHGYGSLEDPSSAISRVSAALDKIAKEDPKALVIISMHAGLHVVKGSWDGGASYNQNQSNDMVKMINEFAENYNMDITVLFGHDHSKGEDELVLKPGETIMSPKDYDTKESEDITLKFTYGHAGYLTNSIGNYEHFSFIQWDDDHIARNLDLADNQGIAEEDARNFDLDRNWQLKEWIWSEDLTSAKAVFTRESNDNSTEVEATLEEEVTRPAAPDKEGEKTITATVVLDGKTYTDVKTVAIPAEKPGDEPGEKPGDQPGEKPGNKPGPKNDNPKTGDESSVLLWTVVLVLCTGTAAVILPRKKMDK